MDRWGKGRKREKEEKEEKVGEEKGEGREERERRGERGERVRVEKRGGECGLGKGTREHKNRPFQARSWCSMGRGSGRRGGGGAEGRRTPKTGPKWHVFGVQGKVEQEGRWR